MVTVFELVAVIAILATRVPIVLLTLVMVSQTAMAMVLALVPTIALATMAGLAMPVNILHAHSTINAMAVVTALATGPITAVATGATLGQIATVVLQVTIVWALCVSNAQIAMDMGHAIATLASAIAILVTQASTATVAPWTVIMITRRAHSSATVTTTGPPAMISMLAPIMMFA